MPSPSYSETEYFDVALRERLADLTQEDMTAAAVLVSIECSGFRPDVHDGFRLDPGLLFELLQGLEPWDADLILSYYICKKSQDTMATIFGYQQSNLSSQIRLAVARLGRLLNNTDPYHHAAFRKHRIEPVMRLIDPPELGMFRIDITSSGFQSLFTSMSEESDYLLSERISAQKDIPARTYKGQSIDNDLRSPTSTPIGERRRECDLKS